MSERLAVRCPGGLEDMLKFHVVMDTKKKKVLTECHIGDVGVWPWLVEHITHGCSATNHTNTHMQN